MKLQTTRRRALLISLPVVSLLVFAWYQLFFSERIDTVVTGKVYRSAQLSPRSFQKIIEEKGIRTVINLRGGSKDAEWYRKEHEISGKANVRLYDIMLSPHDLPDYATLQFILEVLGKAEKPVLIHCRRGSDRTGMVSALAIALEDDPPLGQIKRQFSWRYGVFPFYRSVGPSLFSQYEQWLARTRKTHDRDNLSYWLKNEYRDRQGNLEFFISEVNGVGMKDRKVRIDGNPKKLVMEGWAFDLRTKLRVDGLRITVAKDVSATADFQYIRPDIAEQFGLRGGRGEDSKVGWRAELDISKIAGGCYPVSLALMKKPSETLDVRNAYEVCF